MQVLLGKCDDRSELVEVRFETPPHPQHHIQHQVPTLVTKVDDRTTGLRGTRYVHRTALLLLTVSARKGDRMGVSARKGDRLVAGVLRGEESLGEVP